MRSATRWREIAYLLLAGPLSILSFALVVVAWCGSLTLLLLPAYVSALPGHRASFGLFKVTGVWGAVAACVVGVSVSW